MELVIIKTATIKVTYNVYSSDHSVMKPSGIAIVSFALEIDLFSEKRTMHLVSAAEAPDCEYNSVDSTIQKSENGEALSIPLNVITPVRFCS